ncbi:hypothetical protein UlMin_026082 [Ulmus minor]
MSSFKAASPDGTPSLFYKSYWNTMGDDVVATVRNFFITGHLHPYLNQSNIIQVPKGQNPKTTNQFRPIAVCNVIYKVISNLLANRVMPLLDKLICLTQNDFMPGRSIHNNSVLIQDVIHALKKKRGSQGWMAMKIDLQKAYDRLSWKFLNSVLTAFGFHPRWIRWVLLCYFTTSMTLMLNGASFHSFHPKRDRHTPALHHLLFANNIFLMGKCTVNEGFYFKECLDTLCGWSSQSFNLRKSNIFFNRRASGQISGLVTSLMGFDKISPNSSYLGLPLFKTGFAKDFSFLLEKLESKLADWF